MRVQKLNLENFRCFGTFDIDFDRELTVIVARNGQGKTAVLDGITIALGTFIAAFDHGKGQSIDAADARLERFPHMPNQEAQVPVRVVAEFDVTDVPVQRELSGVKRHKTTSKDARAITDLGIDLMRKVRSGEPVTLPVVALYGSGRLWVTHREKKGSTSRSVSGSRTKGYEDCVSRASNFKQLQEWMKVAETAAIQESQRGNTKTVLAEQLSAIKSSVDAVLKDQGWEGFHYNFSLEGLAISPREDEGARFDYLPVSQLSDGVRAVVSLVADLAWRCTMLNPHLGSKAPLETNGIVLIDEIDLHLHPAWQQTVIGSLRQAFPAVQFILTTHSPQVISTVASDRIRIIEGGVAHSASQGTQGAESSRILERVFGVASRPPDDPNAQKLMKYLKLVFANEWSSETAKSLRVELDLLFGDEEPELFRADEYIANREWELGIEEGS